VADIDKQVWSKMRVVRATTRAEMAFAKSFVFHAVRARRICQHGAGALTIDRAERNRFLNATEVLATLPIDFIGFLPPKKSKQVEHFTGHFTGCESPKFPA
jgi:hypothetical protein